jgi:FtsP/CotA-like multicopper oxidase with cupredoxin domain
MKHDQHGHAHHDTPADTFPTAVDGLPEAVAPAVVELADGDVVGLRIAPVAKRIGDTTVRMLAYNGSIPGPVLRVREGSRLEVRVRNDGDLEGTVHWHGLRLENRYDGTHETQAPIPVGGTFSYAIDFPDPGVYWYHPHIREDYGQELGQYGNIVVVPADPDYWPEAHRELVLTLDDVLIEDGRIAPFSREETTFAAMGRFGNALLVGGETEASFTALRGEVVRLYLTNTANTRVFQVALPGAQLKLVGGDSGRVEREELVDSVLLAPSERAVVDVHFERAGRHILEHRTPDRTYSLATFDVSEEPASPPLAESFGQLRQNPEWAAERERLEAFADAPPDKTLAFVAEMDMGESDDASAYVCPMHPEVVSETPGRCPECGMKLVADTLVAGAGGDHHAHHDHHEHEHHEHGDEEQGDHDHADEHGHEHHDHGHEGGGIEWEDDMVELNRLTTPANMRWQLVDRETGAVNHAIEWTFTVGDRVKLRLVNEMDSDHPMHHPFHVHGAGRFVVLSRDGVPEANLVWKDTVLVRTGETVDILLDVTNPGRWMAHCHIAEHHESGMMLSFDVQPAATGT